MADKQEIYTGERQSWVNADRSLENSCYEEVENCHMMMLIVGGRHGASSAEQESAYEANVVSITHNEYLTARKKGIPVMIFVEQSVHSEYQTYKNNKEVTLPKGFKYAHVDNVNVFKFIEKLEVNAIKVFSQVEEIEGYFVSQISGMLYTYLQQQREKKLMAKY